MSTFEVVMGLTSLAVVVVGLVLAPWARKEGVKEGTVNDGYGDGWLSGSRTNHVGDN
jgi:hypothetical protein